jgi:hypothetical protein
VVEKYVRRGFWLFFPDDAVKLLDNMFGFLGYILKSVPKNPVRFWVGLKITRIYVRLFGTAFNTCGVLVSNFKAGKHPADRARTGFSCMCRNP